MYTVVSKGYLNNLGSLADLIDNKIRKRKNSQWGCFNVHHKQNSSALVWPEVSRQEYHFPKVRGVRST